MTKVSLSPRFFALAPRAFLARTPSQTACFRNHLLSTPLERRLYHAGKATLQLHPRGLQYIAGRLRDLEAIDLIKRTSAVEYLRACATNVQDLGRLERLHNALARARSLRLAASATRRRHA